MNLKNQAASIKQKLSNLAKTHNLSYPNVAMTFLLERLVARITSDKALYEALVFKGGYVGLRIYESTRYTIDLDAILVKSNLRNTLEAVRKTTEKDIDDAVWFKFEKEIDLKSQGEYGGFRQVYRVGIGEIPKNLKRAQLIHFDLGIGDPVTPHPIKSKTPELIGQNELSWFVYPIETIIAEKIHALIDRGEHNSRSKDIFDLSCFLPRAEKENLINALAACFKYRKTQLPKDLVGHLKTIELGLLKRGWPSAVSGIKETPNFEETYQKFLEELQKFFC